MPTHAPKDDPYPVDVVSALKRQLGRTYLGIHQRLDSDTSGVILFTLRREANAGLAAAFASRDVRKHYLALVRGVPVECEGVIDIPIAPALGGGSALASSSDPRAQRAVTRFAVREVAVDRSCALIDLYPETGRTHQLRVHLLGLGTPIVGDSLYDQEHPFPRLMLHAHSLELAHPRGGALRLESPASHAFASVIENPSAIKRASKAARMSTGISTSSVIRDAEVVVSLAVERRAPLLDEQNNACRLFYGAADGIAGSCVDLLDEYVVVDRYDGRESVGDAGGSGSEARVGEVRVGEVRVGGARVGEAPDSGCDTRDPDSCGHVSDSGDAGDNARSDRDDDVAVLRDALAKELPTRRVVTLDELESIPGISITLEGLRFPVRVAGGAIVPRLAYRESLVRVREWARGRTVLACATSTGGLTLAAMSCARDMLAIERSRATVAWMNECSELNGLLDENGRARMGVAVGEVHEQLERLARRERSFGMVVVDVGATLSRVGRDRTWTLERTAVTAARLVAEDGILVLTLDDARVSRRNFRRRVNAAVIDAGIPLETIELYAASVMDFPELPGDESPLKLLALRRSPIA